MRAMRCPNPQYDKVIRAGIVHHTAGSNEYAPEDSAGIIRSIYEYHTRTLGWCDIAYNALVDKYGQVFEGRAGGMTRPVEGAHTGGFNRDTWGVAMLGNFDEVRADPDSVARTRAGCSDGGSALTTSTRRAQWCSPRQAPRSPSSRSARPRRCRPSSPTATWASPNVRAMRHTPRWARSAISRHDSTDRLGPADLADTLRGGAIFMRWESMGGPNSLLGAPRSPEASGEGPVRYANFEHGAIYWSPHERGRTGHRRDLQGMGIAGLRARRAGPADERRNPGAAVGRAELPARHAELRPRERAPSPGSSTRSPPNCRSRCSTTPRSSWSGSPRPSAPRSHNHQRSSTRATPSSAFVAVTSSAAATASG